MNKSNLFKNTPTDTREKKGKVDVHSAVQSAHLKLYNPQILCQRQGTKGTARLHLLHYKRPEQNHCQEKSFSKTKHKTGWALQQVMFQRTLSRTT